MTMKIIDRLTASDLKNQKVLLRVDLNLPEFDKDGVIDDTFRVRAIKPTLAYLISHGARVALASHITAVDSYRDLAPQISEILGREIFFAEDLIGSEAAQLLDDHEVILLNNLRRNPGEEKNEQDFAEKLSKGFNVFINDAFAACHRAHASLTSITEFLPSYAGFLLQKETEQLSRVIQAPAKGKVIVLGGAKISTKLPVIKNFQDKAEKIIIGGALANNFFTYRGIEVGRSLIDPEELGLLADLAYSKIVLPIDMVVSTDQSGMSEAHTMLVSSIAPNEAIFDIGPQTSTLFGDIIASSEMAVWNGPMGMSEITQFREGTLAIAAAMVRSRESILGGGDSISFINSMNMLDQFTHVSTGGGAMLEFLAGNKLPGLDALGYYD